MPKRILSFILMFILAVSCACAEEAAPAAFATPEPEPAGVADLIGHPIESDSAENRILPDGDDMRTLQADLNGTHLTVKALTDESVTDEVWTETVAQYMTLFAAFDWSDLEGLVKAVPEKVKEARAGIALPQGEALPVWLSDSVKIAFVRAESPYYPELSLNVNGETTKQLQEKLITAGFLTDKADGYFGNNTLTAVKEMQSFVGTVLEKKFPGREIEEMTDGVVSRELLYYVLSDDFTAYTGASVTPESDVEEIRRLQRRLIAFGCLTGMADGIFGDNTSRGVRIFQYANGLPETGKADAETLKLLFGKGGKAPAYPLMASGSTGDAVRDLQTRLLYGGFSTVGIDGKYEKGTKAGIEALQEYFREAEKQALIEEAQTAAPAAPAEGETIELPEVEIDESQLATVINGIADPMLLEKFYADDFPLVPSPMSRGAEGQDVKRVQRRLRYLEYIYTTPDGQYGPATEKAVTAFQKRNGLEQTGSCNADTMALLFSDKALKALKPYVLKVDTSKQRVYAYGLDANNEHTVLVRTMKCSTGRNETPTPKGTYQATTGPGARWHYFSKFQCWAQYAYTISGDILFHSVIYYEKEGRVQSSTVSNLGRKASHGCVRLSVEDAKWVWSNCPRNTKVIIY